MRSFCWGESPNARIVREGEALSPELAISNFRGVENQACSLDFWGQVSYEANTLQRVSTQRATWGTGDHNGRGATGAILGSKMAYENGTSRKQSNMKNTTNGLPPELQALASLLLVVLFLLFPCLAFAEEPKPMADTIAVEPHCSLRTLDVIPNDPYFPSQWNLIKIRAPAAWQITTGSDRVVIAVVDSGVDLDHPDLKDKIWTNTDEIPGNGIDDDENGFVDDVHGWDFVNWDNEPQDDWGHGTLVALIAAAETNNGYGGAGVSWGARIMPIKVMDNQGVLYHWHAATGITYAVDNGAKIINLSWTLLSGIDPQPVQDAVSYAHSKGALVIAAAGDGFDSSYKYPAALDHVVSVAATDRDDGHPDFATYNEKVDVAAPGVDILALYGEIYWRYSSTDFAAPLVSGLAALVWSVNPTLTPDEVESIIESTAVDLGEPGRDDYFGYGRIDASAAVLATPHYLQVEPDSLYFLVCDGCAPPSRKITNPNTSYAMWSATAIDDWLSISDPEGYTPSSAMVSIDTDSLPDYGVYTTTIITTSTLSNCVKCQQTVPVTVNYASQCWRSYLPLLFKES